MSLAIVEIAKRGRRPKVKTLKKSVANPTYFLLPFVPMNDLVICFRRFEIPRILTNTARQKEKILWLTGSKSIAENIQATKAARL
jgi:hypothetical protein